MAFCRLPWQGLMITSMGDFRVCALTNSREMNQGMSLDENGKRMNVLTHSFNDGVNGKWHRAVRLHDTATNGEWHELCSCCRDREIATGGAVKHIAASRRQSMERRNPSLLPVNPETFPTVDMDENGYVNWQPTSLDIRFGNLCNMKCIQCGPNYSNQWYDDWYHHYGDSSKWAFGRKTGPIEKTLIKNEHGKVINPNENRWWESDIWWDKFEKLIPSLEHIYLTGGEPMIVPAHDKMLDMLIASGRSKEIYLDYDTNLSVLNDKIARRWDNFKHVEIAGSIDAIQDKYEFIRSGGSWDTFANNVKRVQEYELNGVVKLYRLTSCVQNSTLYTSMETEKWVNDQGIPFQARFVDSPLMHSIMCLPLSAKEELLEYYSQYNTITSNLIIGWINVHLDAKYENPMEIIKYINLMDFLDTSRNTNWRKTIPGTWNLINKHCKI